MPEYETPAFYSLLWIPHFLIQESKDTIGKVLSSEEAIYELTFNYRILSHNAQYSRLGEDSLLSICIDEQILQGNKSDSLLGKVVHNVYRIYHNLSLQEEYWKDGKYNEFASILTHQIIKNKWRTENEDILRKEKFELTKIAKLLNLDR